MSTRADDERLDLLQGTLDLLILRTLILRPEHGQGIARAIQHTSDHELFVEHGALYPALQRLEERGWISAKWGLSANNRKARFYSLTSAGRKQLAAETSKWNRFAAAIARSQNRRSPPTGNSIGSIPPTLGFRNTALL